MISVIVPIYNTEMYLEECLKSLINQTVPFYEIIMVNDGANDICRDICKMYCTENENMVLINQTNQGLSAARNNGIKTATGKYVLFVDSDDLVEKEMNETLLQILSENELDVLYYSAEIKNELDKKVLKNTYIRKAEICNCIMTGKAFLQKTYPDNYIVSACCATYKKSFLENNKILFPQGIFYEDNPFYINIVLKAEKVECIINKLYIRRYRLNSITTSEINAKKCSDMLTVQILIWGIIKSNNIDCKQENTFKDYILKQGVLAANNSLMYEELKQEQENFLVNFMDYWNSLFNIHSLGWNELCALMKIGQLPGGYRSNGQNALFFKEVKRLFLMQLIEKLRNLPFQNRALIAIYGVGLNAKALIRLYELFVGKIQSKICYIVSNRSEMTQVDSRFYTCEEIPTNIETIIISSRVYQKEMLNELKRNGIPAKKVVLFYQENDWYDLAFVAEMIFGEEML